MTQPSAGKKHRKNYFSKANAVITSEGRCLCKPFCLVAVILGVKLHDDIPETDRFFEAYGPSFELSIGKGRRPNRNSDAYIRDTIKLALSKFQNTSNCGNATQNAFVQI